MARPKVVAVDLDDTILHDEFPGMGKPIDGMREQLQAVRELGWKIAIWTVRNEDKEVAERLKKYQIPFDFINENPYGPPNGSRKIYADLYLDNRALTFDGNTKNLARKIVEFKPWNRNG